MAGRTGAPPQRLPPLREDLQISPGAPLVSGDPAWVIYDPIRHKFFQIGQRTIEILSRWPLGTMGTLRDRLLKDRAILASDDELERLISFLRRHNLLALGHAGTAASLSCLEQRNRRTTPLRFLQRVVFFRVPLVRPQHVLEATLPLVRPFMTTGFVWVTGAVLILALYLVQRQHSELIDHTRAVFSPTSPMIYLITIAVLKILHELGHAYQAVSRGVRVPVLGVAFMAMFPLLYTDVSDSWRLRTRRDKIMIDAGGVMTEMVVAVYATLLWCFLPDGALRTATFATATTGWFFSLLVNLNPLMRFDGYYLLADSLGIQNLQTRAFALARSSLRGVLFGLDRPAPEEMGRSMTRLMVVYAVSVWVYRFFLYLSIGLLLYAFLFKALGLVVFAGSLVAFIGKPVMSELRVWHGMRGDIVKSRRSWLSLIVLLITLGLSFWPISTRIAVPAVLEFAHQQAIYPPAAARLAQILVWDGKEVNRGDVLFRLVDPALPIALAKAETRIDMYQSRLLGGAGDMIERGEMVTLTRLLEQERENLSALKDRADDLVVRAAGQGVIRDLARDLQTGIWIERKALLGRIVAPGDFVVRGLIREDDRDRLAPTAPGRFIADDVLLPIVELSGITISDYAVERLPDDYFAASSGGGIPVIPQALDRLVPKGVWYPLNAKVVGTALAGSAHTSVVTRGKVVLTSRPEAFARRVWRRIARVLIRESGF